QIEEEVIEETDYDGFTTYVDKNGRRFRRRGPTVLADLWNMDPNEKIDVEVNKHGTPCGPESGLFASFLGVVARNGLFTPLELNWRKAEFRPYKAKILDLVQEKAYTLRQEGSFDNEQIFQKVHGPEHPGRVRCAGLGPTPSTYLGPSCSSASINSTTTSNSNEVDALRSEVIELRNELAEAKSEVVELRSGMDQLQMEVDTLKTCSCNIFVGRRGQWRVQFVHYLHQAKVLHGVDKR
ncbi:unnamed protein product, partial [Linum tenue]